MWINFDQLLDLPNVTVVNYQKIAQTIFLKLALLNETIECPNCHQTLDRINQTEYNLVRDLSILGNPVYLEVRFFGLSYAIDGVIRDETLIEKDIWRFLSIVFNLERTNQLNLLLDKDLVDLCSLIESYQVTRSQKYHA